jgi:beta-galactosidase
MISKWTRRDLLKAGLAAPAAVITVGRGNAQPARELASHAELPPALAGRIAADERSPSPRERLLLDFGWRFKLGDADDAAKDFGYGVLARERTFAKSGSIVAAGLSFDSRWRGVDLPHDWAVDLPFKDVSGWRSLEESP